MERLKPTIAYVFDNVDRSDSLVMSKAFRRIAETDLGCASIVLDPSLTSNVYGNPDALNNIAALQRSKALFAVVTPGTLDKIPPYHNAAIVDQVRAITKDRVPIFTLDPNIDSETIVRRDDNVYVANPFSDTLLKQIAQLRDQSTEAQQELRIETAIEVAALLKASIKNFPDMNVDENTRVILGYLRWRLLPSEIVREEFDEQLREKVELTPARDNTTFQHDLHRIQRLSSEERIELKAELEGQRRDPKTGLRDCYGFAMDSETFAYEVTYGFGSHFRAAELVENVLRAAKAAQFGRSYKPEFPVDPRKSIIRGIIFKPTIFIQTPVLRLGYDQQKPLDPDLVLKVNKPILKEEKFIPITSSMELIEPI